MSVRIRRNGAPYHPRELAGMQDLDFYHRAREHAHHILLAGPPGSGKCLAPNNTIIDPVSGTKMTVADFAASPTLIYSVALNTNDILPAPTHVQNNGSRPCLTLTTSLGRRTTVTPNHPFLGRQEWKMAKELLPGHAIAVPSHLPQPMSPIRLSDYRVTIQRAVAQTLKGTVPTVLLKYETAAVDYYLSNLPHEVTVNTYEDAETLADLYLRVGILARISGLTVTPTLPTESSLYYDTIVSIEPAGNLPTYAIEVDGWHNHIVSGILSHNTAGLEAAFDSRAEDQPPLTPNDPLGLITLVGSDATIVDDFVGSYTQDPDTGRFTWVDGPLITSLKMGVPFLVDEIALIDPRVLSVLYPLMDGRGVLEVTQNPSLPPVYVPHGWFVCAAYNPNAPGAHISEALLDRFHFHIEVQTDWELAVRMGVPRNIVLVADQLNMQVNRGELSWSPQFRSLLAYKEDVEAFGEELAVQNFVAKAPEDDRPAVVSVLEAMGVGDKNKHVALRLGGEYRGEERERGGKGWS